MHPAHEKQTSEQVYGEIDTGVVGKEGKVGKQPNCAQGEHPPEIAVAEKYPPGEVARQPRGDQQSRRKGQWVNADPFGPSGPDPQAQTFKKLPRVCDLQFVRGSGDHLPDDHAGSNEQTDGKDRCGPKPDAGEQQRG